MLKKIDSNLIYNALYQLLLILVPIVTTPFLARVLGPGALGINGYVGAIAAFLGNFMLLGLNQFGVRTIAKSDSAHLKNNFRDLWGTQLLVSVFLIAGYLFVAKFFLPYKIYLYLELPFLIGYGLDISWFYIGIGQVKRVVVRNTIVKLITVSFIFLLVRNRADLWKYVLINGLAIFMANIVFVIDIHNVGIRLKTINWKNYRLRFFKSLLLLSIPLIAAQLYTNIDSTLVGTFAGTRQLAFYDQSQKISRVILAALTSASTIIMPKMAKIDTKKNQSKLMKVFSVSLDVTFVISLIFAMLVMANTYRFVPFFFGGSFSAMRINMYWVSLIIIFISYGSVFSLQLALAKGLYKAYTIPYLVGAIYSLTMNVLIDSKYGAVGGTFVIVTTELLVCMLRIYLVKKLIDIKGIINRHMNLMLSFMLTLLFIHFVNFNTFNLTVSFIGNSVLVVALFILISILSRDEVLIFYGKHLFFLGDDDR